MIEKVVQIGNCSGEDTEKFKTFTLTPLKAQNVETPLIKECLANIECEVVDISLADKYGLFVMRGLKAWIDKKRKETRTFHAVGNGTFVVDGEIKNLQHLMTKWGQFI
jgi:flavin reductase (DIM6/NTAB) family NADH-FMN oxidoreductase RutF